MLAALLYLFFLFLSINLIQTFSLFVFLPSFLHPIHPITVFSEPTTITTKTKTTTMAPSLDTSTNTVCVMDASGQLGFSLVQKLLQRGYAVHASVQKYGEQDLFKGISVNPDKLKIFRSDPFDYHSIIDALRGCSGLFYTFEPPFDQPNYDEYMVDVEVRAAHNVLEACAQIETIEKVVFTSSVTAVVWREDRKTMEVDLHEKHWSDVNFCRKFKLWHGVSKTMAEKAAWALAMDRGVNMVSINAALLMSHDLSIKHPYLRGAAEMYEDGVFVTVDLCFLVDAHICVYENTSSYGRYLCFNQIINTHLDAVQLARKLTPDTSSSVPRSDDHAESFIEQRISNKKLNKLMVDFEA